MKLAERTFRRECSKAKKKGCYYITSKFGWRKDPISGEYKGHKGCDYGTNGENYKQYALEDGTVEKSYRDGYGAICARIAYPRLGIRLTYAHLDKIYVKTGQKVTKDTVIGLTGTTGYSTGVHLHLGVQKIGKSTWIDPETIDYQEKEEVKPIEPEKPKEDSKEKEDKKDTIKPGDTVIVNGVGNSQSSGRGGNTRRYTNHKMKVIGISNNKNRPNRYALNQNNKGTVGNWSHVTGWFREKDLSK